MNTYTFHLTEKIIRRKKNFYKGLLLLICIGIPLGSFIFAGVSEGIFEAPLEDLFILITIVIASMAILSVVPYIYWRLFVKPISGAKLIITDDYVEKIFNNVSRKIEFKNVKEATIIEKSMFGPYISINRFLLIHGFEDMDTIRDLITHNSPSNVIKQKNNMYRRAFLIGLILIPIYTVGYIYYETVYVSLLIDFFLVFMGVFFIRQAYLDKIDPEAGSKKLSLILGMGFMAFGLIKASVTIDELIGGNTGKWTLVLLLITLAALYPLFSKYKRSQRLVTDKPVLTNQAYYTILSSIVAMLGVVYLIYLGGPIHFTVFHGYSGLTQFLIKNGFDINVKRIVNDNTPLITATKAEQFELVTYLIDQGADVTAKNTWGRTALMYAVYQGNAKMAKHLIQSGAEVNHSDQNGNTPLILATKAEQLELVAYLIDQGAEITAKNDQGWTALIFAAALGNTEIAKHLIQFGANVNHRNQEGQTALIMGTGEGYREIVKLLIENKADIDAKDETGDTALMQTAWHNHPTLANQLIQYGADINIRNSEGETALQIAQNEGFENVATVLKQAGAEPQ